MQNNKNDTNKLEDSLDQNQHIQGLIFRILPYWPLIILILFLGLLGSRIFLRYATKVYEIRARVIVNDESQQKSANLIDLVQLDTRNLSTETEKQMEILGSRNLLGKLASNLQLNVQYVSKGYLKFGENYKNTPFRLELADPDSVSESLFGPVEIINNKIKFNNVLYPCDTVIRSDFGNIKWHINSRNVKTKQENWYLQIQPIASTVTQLQKSLTIEPISKQSSILNITFNDEIPTRGLYILNSLLSLYGATTIDYKSRISENTLRFLDERLNLISDELNGVEKNLQNFKTSNNVVDLSDQGKVVLNQLSQADTKISELNVQTDVLNKIKEYVTRRNNTNNQIPATLGISDPVVIDLLNQLYNTEFELQRIQQTSGSKNPKIEVLQQNIDKLKPSILASINNLEAGIAVSVKSLETGNAKLSAELNKMPVKERLLLDISRQQEIKNGIYTFLLQKKEEAAISAAGIVDNYRIINKPETGGLLKPLPQQIYSVGILIALLIIFIFIYLKEFSSTRLKFKSQIENRVKAPILAEISYDQNKSKSPIVLKEGKRSVIAEEFRELRTNLNYITFNAKEKSKVILVTSSIPNEGKSFISINTAVSLCLNGHTVALLEFDLRKPKVSTELGINHSPGLSNYLIGKATENEIIQKHAEISNFSIIPSGPIPPNPSELIGGPRLSELFSYLKQNYDFIIIDSPPIGAVTDAKILANVSDATLYIIRQNYTHSSVLDLINNVTQKNMLPNLNIVFNGIKVRKIPGYKYGAVYNYGYGYGFGYNEDKASQKRSWLKKIFAKK